MTGGSATRDFYRLSIDAQVERLHQLAVHAIRDWDLPRPELELVDVRENAVFRVTTGDGTRYALRVHRYGYHSTDELRSELQWLRALEAEGVEVPAVVPAATGELLTSVRVDAVPEQRQVDLFEWIDGEQLAAVVERTADETELADVYRTVGELMARLHNQAVAWTPPARFTRMAWDVDGLTGEAPLWGRFWEIDGLSGEERDLIRRGRVRVREDLIAHGRSADGYSIIHADLLPENILVQGDRVRLIDFDDAGFGWHLFDLATTLNIHRGRAHIPVRLAAVVDGYRRQRALPDEALDHLPLFLLARAFTYLGWMSTRQETAAAKCEERGGLIDTVCDLVESYLMG